LQPGLTWRRRTGRKEEVESIIPSSSHRSSTSHRRLAAFLVRLAGGKASEGEAVAVEECAVASMPASAAATAGYSSCW
jgi:hypothetical protein